MTPLDLASFPVQEAGEHPHDNPAKPFSTSKTSNWVARAGGLPHYIQHVAHALAKTHGTSRAIEMAVGIVKNWAEGKGHVHPAIKAAAAKAMAEWEAKKAKAHALKEEAALEDFHDEFVAGCKERLRVLSIALDPDAILEAMQEGSGFMVLTAEEAEFGPDSLAEVDLCQKGRQKMAKAKTARHDGSFPIPNTDFLGKAIKAVGGAKDPAAAKAWIKKRAKALGATKMLPSNWGNAMAESELTQLAEELLDTLMLCEALAEAYNPPTWVIPKQARQPGFKPLKPPKAKSSSTKSSSSKYDPNKHPRDQIGQFLQKGHTGPAVKGIQQKLGIKPTGTYDSSTVARIRTYQENHGLVVDGIVGAQTAASLLGKPKRKIGALPGGLRKGLQGLVKHKLKEEEVLSEALEERTLHTATQQRDNGVKSATHSSIRSAIYDLAGSGSV
jgi:hypothetical protein